MLVSAARRDPTLSAAAAGSESVAADRAAVDIDAALVARLRRRELGAFEAVYARYRVRIYGFLVRLARDRDVADELFQETFVRLARNAHRLREDSNLRAYLYTVARNLYLLQRRQSLFRIGRLRELFFGSAPPTPRSVAPQHLLERGELYQTIEQALSELPDEAREALLLTAVEGLSTEAAAAVVGIQPAALRKRLSRGRKQLRARLLKLGVSVAEALKEDPDAS